MCSATVFFVGLIPDGFQPSGGGRGPKYTENRVCIYYRVKSYMLTKYFNRTILCNGSQPAGDAPIAGAIGIAGLRCGRLRPARPKGRKVNPCHLTVRLKINGDYILFYTTVIFRLAPPPRRLKAVRRRAETELSGSLCKVVYSRLSVYNREFIYSMPYLICSSLPVGSRRLFPTEYPSGIC